MNSNADHPALTFWRRLSTRILAVCLLLATVPLVFLNNTWYLNARNSFIRTAQGNAEQLLAQASMDINSRMSALNTVLLSIVFDSSITAILRNPSESPARNAADTALIESRLSAARNLNDSIAAITLISRDMIYATSSAGERVDYSALFAEDWYRDFVQSGAARSITHIHACEYIARINLPTFTVLHRFSADNAHLRNGYLVAEVYATGIQAALDNLAQGSGTGVIVTDGLGESVYTAGDTSLIARMTDDADTGDHFITKRRLTHAGWTVSLLTDQDALLAEAHRFQRLGYSYLAALLIAVIVLATLLSRQITRPILRLSNATQQVVAGDLTIQVPVTTRDEVGRVSDDFNAMILYIQDLVRRVQSTEQAKFDAEIRALQAQINPHFLYNTLNVIRWLAMMGETEKIDRMTVALVQLLELDRESDLIFIPIARELEHVRRYAELMAVRYEGRFTLHEDVGEEVLDLFTIRFTLQPLVENAIFHGIDPLDREGTVWIRIHREQDRVLFEVSDDGVGMDTASGNRRFYSGMGVSNVNERLVNQLDAQCCIHMNSREGEGTRVSFSIPIMANPPERK